MKNVRERIGSLKSTSSTALTREVLIKAGSDAIQQASMKAMETSGFVIVAEDEWVVRIDKNGNKERLTPIEPIDRPQTIELD